ncbi:hypothetical protein [Megamonas funiformis]|uniref:hypothetical protein n=1 Tax=Megamonas funiformis TaxID=437897 RepID=UPI003F7FA3C5
MKRIKKRADFGGIFNSTIAPVINGIGGVLDSTLSTQGVNKFKTEDTSTETNDVVAMRYGGNARPKCWLGAAIGAATGLASGLIGGAASRKAAKKAAALRNRQNMIQDMQGRDKQLNALYSTYLNNNDNEEDLIYRRGGIATQHPRRRNLTDAQYYSIMKQVAADNWRKWGDASPAAAFNRAINSNAYDYRGYYNKYPNSRANADTHWTDEFKGVGEKTFSDQSKYSGVKHPKYNPNGIRGGHWYGVNENMFVPNIQQLVERSKFARGGRYNFTNFANRLERNVNESDNTRVAGGRRVVNARNRQYRRDNSLIGKVINYIDKSNRASQIRHKGTLTAQQYKNNKAAQTFGRYNRVNYNGKTYYVPQVQGGMAPTVGFSTMKGIPTTVQRVNTVASRLNKANTIIPAGNGVVNLRKSSSVSNVVGKFKQALNKTKQLPIRISGKGNISSEGKFEGMPSANRIRAFLDRRRKAGFNEVETSPINPSNLPTIYKPNMPMVYNNPVNRVRSFLYNNNGIKNYLNSKGIEWNNALRAYSKEHPYATKGIISALGTAALLSAYNVGKSYIQSNNIENNNNSKKTVTKKPVNNSKTKVQPQQVKNDTAQVAKQTPSNSTVVQNNNQIDATKAVNNQTPVANNKTNNQVAPSSKQTSNNKKAAETIQRRGRTKSRVVANRINNNSNNFRQNINFEPLDNTVNGYSQVEDIQGRSYDEYKADVESEEEARRRQRTKDLLSNYNFDEKVVDEMRYGGKARSKRRIPIKITDGGVAQKIGNNTFLLRGGSHEQVNPSGQTGIGIKVGNNEIEAEGGEVAQRVGNALRIFSAQPMINGISPAQAVEAGANKNRIFAIQEALKRRGYKCGGRIKFEVGGDTDGNKKRNWYTGQFEEKTPIYNNLVEQNPKITGYETTGINSNNIGNNNTSSNVDSAPINNWWNRNGMSVNSSDWIGLGTDLAGSLALGALNANAYKNLKYDYKIPNYVDETPVAFDTTYHNGAQRATVERNRLNAQKIIANNTSSANTAVQRMQQANADAMMETNKLWDEKANKEAELRNTAAQNEQQVRARNAAARNQYYQNVAEIQNKRIDAENANRLARSNAWTTSLQGLQGAANNFLNSTRQRFEDENALMATIAAGDAATPYRMMAFGTQFGPRVINAIRAMNNIEGMKDPGAAPVRSNYSNDADYSAARSKWETAMKNYEYWKQRNQFLSHYDRKGYLIKRK